MKRRPLMWALALGATIAPCALAQFPNEPTPAAGIVVDAPNGAIDEGQGYLVPGGDAVLNEPVAYESAMLAPTPAPPAGPPSVPGEGPKTAAPDADAKKKAAELKKKKADLKKAVATAYKPLFFDNKFDYLCNPLYNDWHLGEGLKRKPFGDIGVWDIGGQYRARVHHEQNMRGLGLTGRDDTFLLHRTRLYGNLQMNNARVFVEGIDAESNYENFAPRGIEVNRMDLLNCFVDLKVLDLCEGDVYLRGGRQELLYGAQRLISPLDWANTRRNFDGLKMFYSGKDWNFDAFMTRPVVVSPHDFDSLDERQTFSGAYAQYKGVKDQTLDLYWLHYQNANARFFPNDPFNLPNGLYTQTVGSRWTGSDDDLLWDFEGGYQFGDNRDDSARSAGFWMAGLGKKIDSEWKPTVWAYYDWASGGNSVGTRKGFDHLFPLGHRYHGFMDLYARSNIQTPNILVEVQPAEKLKVMMWYHYFFLQNKNDGPYNVNMAPFSTSAPGSADLGHEIDWLFTYSLDVRTEIQFGYSHFFAGRYYKTTPGLPYTGDANFLYTQFQTNF